ncbi:MAG: hypothetical protein NTW30_05455, partial [Candidatus Aenigmarchaeota archaeon]|nr:hypothetical protein [Candidatus Aenigmarchaeota archaeon]
MLLEKISPNLPYLKKQLDLVSSTIKRYANEVTYPNEVLKVKQTVPISIINYLLGMELKINENNIVDCCVVNDLICRSVSYIDDIIDKSSASLSQLEIDPNLKEVYRLAYGIGFLEVLYHALL